MEVRYFVDPNTGLPHIYNHGVTEDEVDHVLEAWQHRDLGARQTQIFLGRTQAGRALKVIARRGSPLFVITAYEMEGKELQAFRRRERRRGRP